jgi:hypothetical protein
MKTKKTMLGYSLPVLLILILLVSGCTTAGGGTGPGIAILAFEPDFSSVESNDDVKLYLRVQNQGGMEAENVEAELTGIDPTEWGVFVKTKFLGSAGTMIPPRADYGTEGETDTATWEHQAPNLAGTLTQTYNPSVRVYYTYQTVATLPVTLVDEDELRRLIQMGQSLPTRDTVYTAGPLSVNIITGKYIKSTDDWGRTFPITIHIANIGPGSPGSKLKGFDQEDYPVDVRINLPNGLGTAGDCQTYQRIDLWKGRYYDLTCDLRITRAPSIAEERTIEVRLEYDYHLDASTAVTVTGTGQQSYY